MKDGDFEIRFEDEDPWGYDEREVGIRPQSRAGVAGLAAMALSAAVMSWLAWLAWQAIRRQDPADLLVLAGILVAFPAWHVVTKALDRDRRRDDIAARVSQEWIQQHGRPRP